MEFARWLRQLRPHVYVEMFETRRLNGMLIQVTAENAADASRTVPLSLMTAYVFNSLLAFIAAVTLIFCAGNLTEIQSDPNQAPFIQIFYNSTGSKAATVIMVVPIILTFMSALISEVATASRQLWSFSRDGGMPFSRHLEPVRLLSLL